MWACTFLDIWVRIDPLNRQETLDVAGTPRMLPATSFVLTAASPRRFPCSHCAPSVTSMRLLPGAVEHWEPTVLLLVDQRGGHLFGQRVDFKREHRWMDS